MTGGSVASLALDHLRTRPSASRPRVALVAPRADPPLAGRIAAEHPGAVVTVSTDTDPDTLHLDLAAAGPLDLVVDLAGGPGSRERFELAVRHLRPGGLLLARRRAGSPLHRFVEGLAEQQVAGPPRLFGHARRDREALLADLTELAVHPLPNGDVVCRAVHGASVLAKLPEAGHERFLERRPEAGRSLQVRAGGSWASRADVRTSAPHPLNELPTTFDAPDLALRAYDDVVSAGRGTAYGDGFVLPVSYRMPTRPRLTSPPLADVAPRFAGSPPAPPTQTLPGAWFLLETHVPGHFGHALTEQLGHVWGWAAARERLPGLRALVHRPLASWAVELLDAAGVPPDAVEVVPAPVRVETLVTTTAAYVVGGPLHRLVAETHDAVGAALDARSTLTDTPARVFHTRRHGKRVCRNVDEVEAAAEAAGYTVVRPEEHPLPDQVRIVRRAESVAGFGGSGMFHLALAGAPKHAVVIGSENYPMHNEHAFAALHGHRLDLVVTRPDVPREESFTTRAFHSDFAVDWEREGVFLREALAGRG